MGEQITSISITLATLGILGVVVKFFIGFIERKEESMNKVIESFNNTISVHLTEHNSKMDRQTQAFGRLEERVDGLRGCEMRDSKQRT